MKLRLIFIFIIFCFSLALLASCKSKKPLEPVIIENTREVVRTVKDTIYKVEADSSFYKAFVECRDGKPTILQNTIVEKTGNKLQAPVVKFVGNDLKIDCKQEAQNLFKQWRETYIKEHEQKPVYVPQPAYIKKPFTVWQKTQLWFGRIFMGLIAISTIIGICRKTGVL